MKATAMRVRGPKATQIVNRSFRKEPVLRARDADRPESLVPLVQEQGGLLPLAGLTYLALALLAAFLVVLSAFAPSLSRTLFDEVIIAFGTLLATGLVFAMRWTIVAHERRLARERNLLLTIFDGLPDGVFAKDLDGRYVFANRKFAERKDARSAAAILGKTVFDFMPEELAAVITAEDVELRNGRTGLVDRELSMPDKRGNVKWDITTRVPLAGKDGAVVGIAGVQRDITRSKQMEQKLREQETRLLAAQKIGQLGSFELDLTRGTELEECPMRCSAELLRIAGFGAQQRELARKSTNIFHLVVAEDWSQTKNAIATAIRNVQPYVLDFRILSCDGTQRDVQCAGDVICEPQTGMPTKLQGIVHDVTDRKRAEAQLEQANTQLARHVQELEQRSKELNLLSEMGGWLQSCNTIGEAYTTISNSVEMLFPKWAGTLCTISASRNVVEVVAEWGPPVRSERVFAPEDCWALRRGRMSWFDAEKKSLACVHADGPEVRESLCVPLMAHGEALGVFHLQPREKPITRDATRGSRVEADRKLASVLAEQIGLALGNLKLRETLRNQSIRDPLTGLFNRRYMEESLEREISRAVRDKCSVAILMLDIDRFKEFNDTYGHQAGDAALRTLGDFLKKTVRGQDIVCRYGGEEFALVFGGSSLEGALERAQSLREGVKRLEVHSGGQLLGALTVSMGIALFPNHGLTLADVLREADEALYCAKREGRDKISVWTADSPA